MSKDRCTFAIISHPDAGKTTMTEKLLWFGNVIRSTGMVKSKSGQFAKSDWMEMEKQRGISITSSVMSFEYSDRYLHLLDTPGHKDFSEDTYRTLTAVESVLMMIDSAKGVEAQTIKLMEVCRMRDTPIVTFMNKFDRESMSAFDLLENIEKICSIQCCPMTWPIGSGSDFKGVINLKTRKIYSFEESADALSPRVIDAKDLRSPEVAEYIGEHLLDQLEEELEMVEELLPKFNKEEFLAGIQTPVFFGSALYTFGVIETINLICDLCPTPKKREVLVFPYESDTPKKVVFPEDKEFSGFIFKIQANMDKRHRDRMAFLRICSGRFQRGEKIFHVRKGKEIKINTPVIFQSRDRAMAVEALPGDIIGITGDFQIGDTLTNGEKIMFTGIPRFAPELFMRVILKDPFKGKHLEKGLSQLSEEGAVQLFTRLQGKEKLLGAVGALQFDVVKFRIEDEYNVRGDYQASPFMGVRWLLFENKKDEEKFMTDFHFNIAFDTQGRICFAMKNDWELKMAMEKNPTVKFFKNSDYI